MCDCDLCMRNRIFEAELVKLPPDSKIIFEHLYDLLNNVEMDRSYYKAIVDGSWPSANEIIASSRRKNKAQVENKKEA